jgi:hypothetical protein
MGNIYNKGEKFLTLHSGDCIKEYYRTDCLGKVLEVTTNVSNNTSKQLVSTADLSDKVIKQFFPSVTSEVSKN